MERKIIIRDYADVRKEITIPNFEKVLKIDCDVITGDEILTVLYDNLTAVCFDSCDSYRLMDFYDCSYDIYIKDKLDVIDKFNVRRTSYDDII